MAITIEIKGDDKTLYLKKNTLRIDKKLNKRRTLSLIFNCYANDWLPDFGQDIKIYDDGDIIFGGVINKIAKYKVDNQQNANAYLEVSVTSEGYEHICARRTINCYYENRSAGYIFENICNRVLNYETADENVTYTASVSGNTFSLYTASCESVKTIFDDIALQSGLQWYIDDTKQVVLTDEISIVTSIFTIDVTASFTDYLILGESGDLADYCNKVFIKGNSEGVYTSVEDSGEILNRISAEGSAYSSGVYGKVIVASDIEALTALTTIGDNELKKYSFSPSTINVRSFTSGWEVGTQIKCYLPEYGMTNNVYYLIEELAIWRFDVDILAYDMLLSKRKTADFSTQKYDKGQEYFEKLIKSGNKMEGIFSGVTGTIKNYQKINTSQITINDS